MAYIFEEWKKMLEKFQQCVDKGVEEMHQQKAEVQQIKTDIFNRLDRGAYYHDDERIVISAPEIVIGNVDKSGTLNGGCVGTVVIKGSDVSLEGVGETGRIVSRAPIIHQKAVNPGIDGRENVVCDSSEIVSQACDIVLHSSDAKDEFSQIPVHAGRGGISLHADQRFNIEAAVTAERRKKQIEAIIKGLDTQSKELKKSVEDQKKAVDKFLQDMIKLAEKEEKLNAAKDHSTFTNLTDISEIHEQIEALLPSVYRSTQTFIDLVSELAEVNRRKKALEKEKGTIKTGDDFKKKSTGASMSVVAENISVATADGDGNLHTNPEAGISVRLGLLSLFVMIAIAVVLFVLDGLADSSFMDYVTNALDTEYDVSGLVRERREKYRRTHSGLLAGGIALCVTAVIPLILFAAPIEGGFSLKNLYPLAVVLILVGVGVLCIVKTNIIWGSYDILLEEGEFSKEAKTEAHRNRLITSFYWTAATVIYLLWSFVTFQWNMTWIIWPIAGVAYGLLAAILRIVHKRG